MNDADRYDFFQPPPGRHPTHPTVVPAPGTTHADAEMRSRMPYTHEDIFLAPGGVEVPERTAPVVERGSRSTAFPMFVPPSATSGMELLDALKRGTEVDPVLRDQQKKASSAKNWEELGVAQQQRDQTRGLGVGLSAAENKDLLRDSARAAGEDFDPRTKVGPHGGQAGKTRTQKKAAKVNKPGSTISARGKIRRNPRLAAVADGGPGASEQPSALRGVRMAAPGDGGKEVTVRYVEPKKKEN